MYNKIITIGREFGSGGRTIAKIVADKLSIPCYDKEIIDEVAVESGLLKEEIEKNGEQLSAGIKTPTIFTLYNLYSNMTKDDIIWHAQIKVIKQLAEKGPCVIVGRCADYVLRERDDIVKVFIYAGEKSKAERIVEIYGENDDLPEKRVKEKDKKRAAYYEHFTGMVWGDPKHYDICLNSEMLGIDKCAEIIASL